MQLLQVTALCFLLSNSLCFGEESTGIQNNSTTSPIENSTTKASAITPGTVSVTNLNKSTDGTPPEGVTSHEEPKTPVVTALNLTTTPKHEVKMTTDGPQKNEVTTIKTTVQNTSISNAVATLPSSQNTTKNQSSIRTTEISVTIQLPDDSQKTTETPSASLTTAKTISQLRDAEDGKVTATPSTTPSYSSIILPVVIALIVITLLVFTLVGLYRICWKRDPGTPENGNDQPPSDKESVKLLTVKTISHEPGEHSAQGKTKN